MAAVLQPLPVLAADLCVKTNHWSGIHFCKSDLEGTVNCRHCAAKHLVFNGLTSHLVQHLRHKHRPLVEEQEAAQARKRPAPITSFLEPTLAERMKKWIVMSNLPLGRRHQHFHCQLSAWCTQSSSRHLPPSHQSSCIGSQTEAPFRCAWNPTPDGVGCAYG
jgi:hypothetical protein